MTKPYTSDNCRLRAVQDPANTTRAAATTAYTAENLTNALEREPDLRDALSHAVYRRPKDISRISQAEAPNGSNPAAPFMLFTRNMNERTRAND